MRRLSMVWALCLLVTVGAAWGELADKERRPSTLYVEILDEHGQPAPDVDVQCVRQSYNGPLRTEPASEAEHGKSGPDGICVFKDLVDMSLIVYAVKDDTYAIDDFIFLEGGIHDVRLKLAPGRRVHGFVHTRDGKPLAGVRVLWEQSFIVTESDADGRFTAPELTTGASFSKDGYGYVRADRLWGDYDVLMVPETIVEGTVTLEDGTPAVGAGVSFFDDWVTTDDKGYFRATGLTQGHEVHFHFGYESQGQRWVCETRIPIGPPPSQRVSIPLKKFVPPPQATRRPLTGDVVFASLARKSNAPVQMPERHFSPARVAQASPANSASSASGRTYPFAGVVVDEEGKPVDGVDIIFQQNLGGSRETEWLEADGRGHFNGSFKKPGTWTLHKIWRLLTYQTGPNPSEIRQEQPEMRIVDGGTVTVTVTDGAEVPPLRIVVGKGKPVPEGMFRGVVKDTEGNLLTPKITVFCADWKPAECYCEKGEFGFSPPLHPPALLQFIVPGYKPCLMEMERDFDPEAMQIFVLMKKGPFRPDESVWNALTGRFDTEEETRKQFKGQYIREHLEEFRKIAMPPGSEP